MYSSQNIAPFVEGQFMDPKDERLVLMAYNVGRGEHLMDENYAIRKENELLKRESSNMSNEIDTIRHDRNYWRSLYRELEGKYEQLKAKTTKKKVSKK